MSKNNFRLQRFEIIFLALFHFIVFKGFAQPVTFLSRPIVLKGTIVTPRLILQNGGVVIENHKISIIFDSTQRMILPNAIYVDTKGIIFPGLIDLHNHVSWNVFQRWRPGRAKFNNRYEWRFRSPEFQEMVGKPYDNMGNFFCKMNTYGELRALVGGTTSILNTADEECIRGLVRNLDDPKQLDLRNIHYLIDIYNQGPHTDADFEADLAAEKEKILSGNLDAFFIHLAEGKASDPQSKGEFISLQAKGLLTGKTAIIHGIALGPGEFQEMHNAGASLVWSPRSNIELYGQTADIAAAKNKGVRIALGPDWAISGSNNLLEELHYAAEWNINHLDTLLSYKDLVQMVTSIPASIAGVSDKVGSISPGLFADLLVISGEVSEPYRSLVQAGIDDVKLVFVNGSPLYGRQDLMEKFWNTSQLEVILNSTPAMVLKLPLPINSMENFKDLEKSLRVEMAKEHVKLAPLFRPVKSKEGKKVNMDKLLNHND